MKKTIAASAIAGAAFMASTGPALARHDHFIERTDRNGETHCRYIAAGQTSKDSSQPGGHKFHDNVHKGTPGSDEHGTSFNKTGETDDPYIYEDDCDYVYERDDQNARRNPDYEG